MDENDNLVEEFVACLETLQEESFDLAKKKWHHIFEKLKELELPDLSTKFEDYCQQLPILGYNSSNYDLNLLKGTLAHHLGLYEDKSFVIKKQNQYVCINTPKFKFLDLMNFVAPGCSYSSFLKAYNTEQKKGYFPYEWMTSKEKLKESQLPPYSAFWSSLKDCYTCTPDEYEDLKKVWLDENMTTMKDYLLWYNALDTRPGVEAVCKMIKFYNNKNLDMFKEAVSLPGLARKLLFRNCEAHFSLVDKKDEDMYHTLKQNVIGGPAIIFTRHHKVNETRIRGEKLCKSIQGYDANALYLWAISQEMPTGFYVRRFRDQNFKPEKPCKYLDQFFWMDKVAEEEGIYIKHKLNSGKEHRVGPYYLDGFNSETNTAFEFNGCYYHGHDCYLTTNMDENKKRERQQRTLKREEYIREQGMNLQTIWECEYKRTVESHIHKDKYLPTYYLSHKGGLSEEKILCDVQNGTLFGCLEVDIEVPAHLREKFAEMSPLFVTSDVHFEDIGEHMKQHVTDHNLSTHSKRLLVGGMAAKKLLLATPLLKWYVEHGLVITKVYQVIEYEPKTCFKQFAQDVSDARRTGDINPDTSIIADTMKLIGNSSYGSTIMDKTKHIKVTYHNNVHDVRKEINKPQFVRLFDLENDVCEVEKHKKNINLDTTLQVGFFILQLAKLRMLSFYYDCVDAHVDRSDFELCEMDTDSFYMALTSESLETIMKSHLSNSCNTDPDWFPRTCCDTHEKYDRRTPGLFKLEAQGKEMICLNSKTYLLSKDDGFKMSCKGIQKCRVEKPMDVFKSVLETGKSVSKVNRGFRALNNSIFTYEQERSGFVYTYWKRQVEEDGIHTKPLETVLSPWTDYGTHNIYEDNVLSLKYPTQLPYDGYVFQTMQNLYEYRKAQQNNQLDIAAAAVCCHQSSLKISQLLKDTCGYVRIDIKLCKRSFISDFS